MTPTPYPIFNGECADAIIFYVDVFGGEVTMPWEPTFWSAGFGALRDKFGVGWMIGSDEPPAG